MFFEYSPFVKDIKNYQQNELDLDLLKFDNLEVNLSMMLQDMKDHGFSRHEKIRERKTYLLYVFLYYNIFTNKIDLLKKRERDEYLQLQRIRFFEYSFLYVRINSEIDKPHKIQENII